jgi:hypothetical protein
VADVRGAGLGVDDVRGHRRRPREGRAGGLHRRYLHSSCYDGFLANAHPVVLFFGIGLGFAIHHKITKPGVPLLVPLLEVCPTWRCNSHSFLHFPAVRLRNRRRIVISSDITADNFKLPFAVMCGIARKATRGLLHLLASIPSWASFLRARSYSPSNSPRCRRIRSSSTRTTRNERYTRPTFFT